MKKALVLGAGGFIGNSLAKRLKEDGFYVKGADLVLPQFSRSPVNEFVTGDLRIPDFCRSLFIENYDRVYQLAADMGGAGYVFTGDHDATIMSNSVQINVNVLNSARLNMPGVLFFASSACVYPEPLSTENMYVEHTAYPANADSEYGWEKLFSERMYLAYARNFGLNVRIARLHNIYGPESLYQGGREKAIAAICRKVLLASDEDRIEIWGDGQQTRSFLYIDECLEGFERLVNSGYSLPINIGSAEMISIQELTKMIIEISGKNISITNIDGPKGVNVRTSNNELIKKELNWAPNYPLRKGIRKTYEWIAAMISKTKQ